MILSAGGGGCGSGTGLEPNSVNRTQTNVRSEHPFAHEQTLAEHPTKYNIYMLEHNTRTRTFPCRTPNTDHPPAVHQTNRQTNWPAEPASQPNGQPTHQRPQVQANHLSKHVLFEHRPNLTNKTSIQRTRTPTSPASNTLETEHVRIIQIGHEVGNMGMRRGT